MNLKHLDTQFEKLRAATACQLSKLSKLKKDINGPGYRDFLAALGSGRGLTAESVSRLFVRCAARPMDIEFILSAHYASRATSHLARYYTVRLVRRHPRSLATIGKLEFPLSLLFSAQERKTLDSECKEHAAFKSRLEAEDAYRKYLHLKARFERPRGYDQGAVRSTKV